MPFGALAIRDGLEAPLAGNLAVLFASRGTSNDRMKDSYLFTIAGYVLVNPVTGLFFDGTNFSATAGGARLFAEEPNEIVLRAAWPGALIRIMTTSGTLLPVPSIKERLTVHLTNGETTTDAGFMDVDAVHAEVRTALGHREPPAQDPDPMMRPEVLRSYQMFPEQADCKD